MDALAKALEEAPDSGISHAHAHALNELVLRERPQLVIEIGMARGVSTIAILTALEAVGGGELVSIDPFQTTSFESEGLKRVSSAHLGDRHRHVDETDFAALPILLSTYAASTDLVYIDGMHTFDYTLLDAFYADKLLRVGGIVGFNDCWMPAVNRVVGWLNTHRRYDEVDVGLKPSWWPRFRGAGRLKRLGAPSRLVSYRGEDRYFRKAEAWEPDWAFYDDF